MVASNATKTAAILAAQRTGRVSDRYPAEELLLLVVGLSTLGSAELAPVPDAGALANRRRTVVDAVARLTRAGSEGLAEIDDRGGI